MKALLDRVLPEPLTAKVPEITVLFWVIKLLTTAGGEATADYFANHNLMLGAVVEGVVLLGAAGFQLSCRRYFAPAYWMLAYAIAIFGTSVSDVMHRSVGIPYLATSLFWIVALAIVFFLWHRSERTLSIHTVVTRPRELYYWAIVFATFALGTALGDLTAYTLHLGFLTSGVLFTVVFAVPALSWRLLGWNEVVAFWFAYIVTRPLGASFADWVGKPRVLRGLGFGDAPTSFAIAAAILMLVAVSTKTGANVRDLGLSVSLAPEVE